MPKRPLFVNVQLERIINTPPTELSADTVIQEFKNHYQELYSTDIKAGKRRKLSSLSSVQSSLSRLKTKAIKAGIDIDFCNKLKLSDMDTSSLKRERLQNVVSASTNLPVVNGYDILFSCQQILKDKEDPVAMVIALCALTGRRVCEVVWSATFTTAKNKHPRCKYFWMNIDGMAKQRDEVRESMDIPVFAHPDVVSEALDYIRTHLPATSKSAVNRLYGHRIAVKFKQMFPAIKKVHNMRKVYIQLVYMYFNNDNESIPVLAARVLGHKSMSSCVLTYLGGVQLDDHQHIQHQVVPLRNRYTSRPSLKRATSF